MAQSHTLSSFSNVFFAVILILGLLIVKYNLELFEHIIGYDDDAVLTQMYGEILILLFLFNTHGL